MSLSVGAIIGLSFAIGFGPPLICALILWLYDRINGYGEHSEHSGVGAMFIMYALVCLGICTGICVTAALIFGLVEGLS